MSFAKFFNLLARTKKQAAAIDKVQYSAADEAEYYEAARQNLTKAIDELKTTLTFGIILQEPSASDPRTMRIITRFPPDDSKNPPVGGYIMEIFDVRTDPYKGKPVPTYEVKRWEIDDIYWPETVDGTVEGRTVHNLTQVLGTILRRSERLQFIDDLPPAAKASAAVSTLRNG